MQGVGLRRASAAVGLAALLFLAASGSAAAEAPDIVWSGTIDESHRWISSDAAIDGYGCQGDLQWQVETEWTIGGSSARSASPPDGGNPGVASSYRVGPPAVGGSTPGGSVICESSSPCLGVAVYLSNVRVGVVGTEWSPRLTYDPATGRLAIDSLGSPSPQGSVVAQVDQTKAHPPPPFPSCGSDQTTTATVSGVGFPNRVNQGPQDLPLEDYRLQTTLGSDGKLRVDTAGPLEVSGAHGYRSSGPRDGFSFNAFDGGGFIHFGASQGWTYETLVTRLSADLVGTCSDAAANICGELTSAQARKAARKALAAEYRNRFANGRNKRITAREDPSGTFEHRVSWKFENRRGSTRRFAGTVTVSGDPSDPQTVVAITAR